MHESPSVSVPEFDQTDLDAIQIHFEVEDRWECYRILQLCIGFLVKREKVYLGGESYYLKKAIVKYSADLVRTIAPETKINEAFELMNELLAGHTFPLREATFVETLLRHINSVLASFRHGQAIPYKTNLGRRSVPAKIHLRLENR